MKLHKLLLLFAALTFSASCGGDDPILPPGEDGGNNEQPGGEEEELDAEAKAIVSRMETPEILRDGSTLLICHTSSETVNGAKKDVVTYTIEYDKKEYHSRWVAFRFDSATRKKNVSRSGSFMDDPLLPSDCQIGSSSYSGYDRGHLCASADRLYSLDANQNTFYMSNMSPQLSSFNQGYWVTLEGLVQKLGRNEGFSDTLYVVKGGTIRDGQILTHVNRSNGAKVAVPKYYFMALLRIKNGIYSSIGFLLEHKNYNYTYEDPVAESAMKKHAMSINQLETTTGINFFPNLPDTKEESIENQCITSVWGL